MEPDIIFDEIQNILKSNPLFGDFMSRDVTTSLLTNSLVRPLEQDEVLCRQNMISQSMFLIISGEVEVSILSEESVVTLANRHKGDLIGEISTLFMMPHIATVTATKPSVVLEIPTEIFIGIMTDNHDLQSTILARCKKRIIETALRQTSVFRELNQEEFSELSRLSSMTTASKGELITHEGDNEHSMYVICKGAVRVFTNVNGNDVTVAFRRAGEIFGEYSYLTGQARTASIVALTDLQLVKLEGEALHSFMEYNESTESSIKQTANLRKSNLDKLRVETDIFAAEDEKNIAVKRQDRIKKMLKFRP
jgi:CRP-like cAMP-binding protein